MGNVFVFLHVGPAVTCPSLLVRSIRRLMPDAEIIQCSDQSSPAVQGVSRVFRIECDDLRNLMSVRLKSFSDLHLTSPALYVDTDLLMLKSIDIMSILEDRDAMLCRRDFDRDLIFNHTLNGLNFDEYRGQTLDDVFPYVACVTATISYEFWEDCMFALDVMDEQYHRWYGDQEALKVVAQSARFSVGHIPERLVGCLPERISPSESPYFMHFKGAARKDLMTGWSVKLGLIDPSTGSLL